MKVIIVGGVAGGSKSFNRVPCLAGTYNHWC